MSGNKKISKVAVIGAGNMGAAIAEVLAFNGYEVILKEVSQKLLDSGMERIRSIGSTLVKYEAGKASKELSRMARLGIRLRKAIFWKATRLHFQKMTLMRSCHGLNRFLTIPA